MRIISDFFWGLFLPFRALVLILRHGTLLLLSAVPVVIALVLSIFLFRTGTGELRSLVEPTIVGAVSKLGVGFLTTGAEWLLSALLTIATFLVLIFLFAFLTNIIALPFNDYLAKRVEPLSTPPLPTVPEPNWGETIRLLIVDLSKSLAALICLLFALTLSLIPIVQIIALLLTWLLLAYQYLSYPQTRRGVTTVESLRYLLRNAPLCLGFGVTLSFGFAIPVLNILMTPLGVVGGTLLFARTQAPHR